MGHLDELGCFVSSMKVACLPISVVSVATYDDWKAKQSSGIQDWLDWQAFVGEPGQLCLLPSEDAGGVNAVVVGANLTDLQATFRQLPQRLPEGHYCLADTSYSTNEKAEIYLAWGLGSYEYARYRQAKLSKARLLVADYDSSEWLFNSIMADYGVRDLVNTPNADLGPDELAKAVIKVADEYQASIKDVVGDDLLKENFPAIHAVGRCSSQAPRLIEMSWGDASHPEVVLVGKGVCFDSGGMDLKPPAGMLRMKKDMAGAAHALGLARLVMANQLPVYLRVLIPAVRNGIGQDAYCPGDVIKTRAGFSVEVNNTDAEGRLILGDAMAYACESKPALLLNFATLTGARALGPDMVAMFTRQDELASELMSSVNLAGEAMWRLPLHEPYNRYFKSSIADTTNSSEKAFAGAICGAVYLARNVSESIPWAHFDLYAWQDDTKPGSPAGARVDLLHRMLTFLQKRF